MFGITVVIVRSIVSLYLIIKLSHSVYVASWGSRLGIGIRYNYSLTTLQHWMHVSHGGSICPGGGGGGHSVPSYIP